MKKKNTKSKSRPSLETKEEKHQFLKNLGMDPKAPCTREDRIKILEEFGIPMAPPDDPVYKQGPTIAFIPRRRKP